MAKSDSENPSASNRMPEHGPDYYMELGKTEARQAFLQLVDQVQEEQLPIAITDRGEKVAVMMSMKLYKSLLEILKPRSKPGINPFAGTFKTVGNLDKASAEVSTLIDKAVKKSARSI